MQARGVLNVAFARKGGALLMVAAGLGLWLASGAREAEADAKPAAATYYVSITNVIDSMLDHGRPSTEVVSESTGVGRGPNFENCHEIGFWLYEDPDGHDNPISTIPEDLEVRFEIVDPTGPLTQATLGPPAVAPSTGDDYRLMDMKDGDGLQAPAVLVHSGSWGAPGAIYKKILTAGHALTNLRNRLRFDAFEDGAGQNEGYEAAQIKIVQLEPVSGQSQNTYEVSTFNKEFRWILKDQ